MYEFKVQIIGVIIAITLFAMIYSKIANVFEEVWQQLENKIATHWSE